MEIYIKWKEKHEGEPEKIEGVRKENKIERGVMLKKRLSLLVICQLAYANYMLSIYDFPIFVKYIVKNFFSCKIRSINKRRIIYALQRL